MPSRLLPIGAAAMVLALSLPLAPAAPAQEIPVRDFFRNPERSHFRISPDGRTLSYMQPHERRLNIHVQPVGARLGTAKRITAETARDISSYFWKGNRIVYLKDFGGDENFHLVSVDRDGRNLRDLTPYDGVQARLVDELREFPDLMLVGLNRRNKEIHDVYRVNLRTGAVDLVAQNPGNITQWLTDHKGRLRVAVATDGVNNTLLYRVRESDAFRPIATTSFREQLAPLFFTFDDRQLYVASNRGRDKTAVMTFDPETAREGAVIFEHPEVDVEELAWSRKRKVLTVATYNTWRPERRYLDPDTAAMFTRLERKLPGYEVIVQSMTDDERIATIAAFSDRTQGSRYLYDVRADRLTRLGEIAPWLPEEKLARMQPIRYLARDGLMINGYLTLPPGKEARNLPVVVNPHGGPWARDGWGFNPEVQLLANRGYAVLQMNFRGSTGYGRKFWEASFKQWGRAMQDDITDGVQYLIREGVADPKRICIYGASYGGYATLAGLAFTPELYACGIDYVGVSNLFTFLATIPPYWKPYLEMTYEMVGHPERDKALLAAASPALNADRIRAPLLIAQGAKDPRVKIDESNQMVAALKARGIDVPYIVKENEGHGFSNEENRFEFYEAMERFLARYLRTP